MPQSAAQGADKTQEQSRPFDTAFGPQVVLLCDHARQAQRREHRDQHQRHHQRGYQRVGDGQGLIAEELAGDALDEDDG